MTEMIPAWIGEKLTPVDKREAHSLGLRHKAVSVFVMAGREVLIQKRASGKAHSAGLWGNSCCSHPLWGEAQHDCAIRRMREELGITGLYPSHADRMEYRVDLGGGLTEHEVVDVFLADAPRDIALAPAAAEVAEVRWVELHDLAAEVERHPQRFSRWLTIYMTEHKDRIFRTLG